MKNGTSFLFLSTKLVSSKFDFEILNHKPLSFIDLLKLSLIFV